MFAVFSKLNNLRRSGTQQQLMLAILVCGGSFVFIFGSYFNQDFLLPLSSRTAEKIFGRDDISALTQSPQLSLSLFEDVQGWENHQNISSKNPSPERPQKFAAEKLIVSTLLPNDKSSQSFKASDVISSAKNANRDPLDSSRTADERFPDETFNTDSKTVQEAKKRRKKEPQRQEKSSVNPYLPLAIANLKEKNVDFVKLNATSKPTTWLQLIQRGIAQRNQDYIENSVTVVPNGLAATSKASGNSTALKKILYWNGFYGRKDFHFGIGQEPFRNAGCPVSSCYATFDRTLFPLEEIDAIVWHGRSDDKSFPSIRYPHTRYVFFMVESPEHTHLSLARYKNTFNYTMTYRTDSDIYHPYGIFVPRPEPRLDLLTKNYAQNKTGMAAWFVSNCDTPSERKRVVKYLKNFIKVDVFGKCGMKTCPKVNDHNPDECFRLIEAKYKFYFAFENSLCDHYVTEKFFGAARFDILPVVYGLGMYEHLAPPHSYVNVFDFPSLRELAEHLLHLDRNDSAYSEYFHWKAKYKAVMGYRAQATPEYRHISWCQLCSKLHSDTSLTIYQDLDNWRHHYNCIQRDSSIFSTFLIGVNVSQVG